MLRTILDVVLLGDGLGACLSPCRLRNSSRALPALQRRLGLELGDECLDVFFCLANALMRGVSLLAQDAFFFSFDFFKAVH